MSVPEVIKKIQLACLLPSLAAAASLSYNRPVERLGIGQSFGNLTTYVTLDRKSNVQNDAHSVRRGFRESTNQRYYALGWNVELQSASGESATAVSTSFYPAHQQHILPARRR